MQFISTSVSSVSQHALAVEVNEGERSVLLPYGLRGQNRRYSGRTSVRPDTLDTLDFSLTLRKPQLIDSGSYTCSISAGREEQTLTDTQLQVKGQQQTPAYHTGQESVLFHAFLSLCLDYCNVLLTRLEK
uniref:Immunoglobulin V-set domain-containing protein n=1 Tax=Neolamprologus brichardi TaxID=32507 RepID=A0A3Q4GWL5_NEOBR